MRRSLALLATMVRLMAFAAAFQASGLAHFVSDTVVEIAVGHHDDDATDHESDPNHECPPGCPTCHHVHATSVSLPAPVVPLALVSSAIPDHEVPDLGYDADAPPGPLLPSVYRPPRA